MSVKPIPEGHHTITPYLVVADVAGLIEFVKAAFNANEKFVSKSSDGAITHAEVQIGDSRVMMGAARGNHAPMVAMLYMYVPDCDAVYAQAVRAGGTSISEPADTFYGDRVGAIKDVAGNQWYIATNKEIVSAEEIASRATASSANK